MSEKHTHMFDYIYRRWKGLTYVTWKPKINASYVTPQFWRKTQIGNLQARQVNLSRLCHLLSCFAAWKAGSAREETREVHFLQV